MDNFNKLVEWVRNEFRGWNITNKPTIVKVGDLHSILFLIKDHAVQIDRIHLMYYKDTHDLESVVAGKRVKGFDKVYKQISEYKEQCLCNSKSMLVS